MQDVAPPFQPRFTNDDDGGWYYDDGRITGTVTVDRDAQHLIIHEWNSEFPGQGHSEEALRWFRRQGFAKITANGVGLVEDGVGDIATFYWQHMFAKGLVDQLIDDNHIDISPPLTEEVAVNRILTDPDPNQRGGVGTRLEWHLLWNNSRGV